MEKISRRQAAVEAEDGTANGARLRSCVCSTRNMRISSRSRTRATPSASRRICCIPSACVGRELAPRSIRRRYKRPGSCCSSRRVLCENPHVVRGANPVFCTTRRQHTRVPSTTMECAGQGSPGRCVCKVTGTAAPETTLSVKASSVHSLRSP